jgi:hypothetical protein
MSAKDALYAYYSKQAKKSLKPRRKSKNASPENDFKAEIVNWLESQNFLINVVESKAVYSVSAGRYLRGQTEAGFSDLVGVTPYRGVACFIELKAPGKRTTLREAQRAFLISKINHQAFAVCVDSIDSFRTVYVAWLDLIQKERIMEAKNLLLKHLP